MSTTKTLGYTKLPDRFIPNLKGKADDEVVREVRRIWNSVFGLRDASMDIVDQTLTANVLLDRDLVPGKPVLFFLRQDATGGRTATFNTLPDGTLKWKGVGGTVIATTTANTYTVLLFMATADNEALLISKTSGLNLS